MMQFLHVLLPERISEMDLNEIKILRFKSDNCSH